MMTRSTVQDAVTHRVLDLDILQASRSAGDPLSLVKLRALLSLSDIGMQSVDQLAGRLHVKTEVIDRICQPLVTRGFVIRIPRAALAGSSSIVLSTAGRRFVNYLLYRNADAFATRRTSALADPDGKVEAL